MLHRRPVLLMGKTGRHSFCKRNKDYFQNHHADLWDEMIHSHCIIPNQRWSLFRTIIPSSWPYWGPPIWLPAGYNPIKRSVHVTCSHISQSFFPHHVCAIALLCHVRAFVFVCVCTCECVCVCVSCPSLLPPPPRRLGVCTLPTVLVPTSEPPGTTTKAHSPPSGMYRHHHHHHRSPFPSDNLQPQCINITQKTNQLLPFFFPPHLPSLTSYPTHMFLPHPLFSSHTLPC